MTRQERYRLKWKLQKYWNDSGWFLASGLGFMSVIMILLALEAKGII